MRDARRITSPTLEGRSAAQSAYWNLPLDELFRQFKSSPAGLTQAEADRRVALAASTALAPHGAFSIIQLLARQFESPITMLLTAAASLSFLLRDSLDAVIILTIVLASALLGFWQEWAAADAVAKLAAIVATQARVLRDGSFCDVPFAHVAVGDVVQLGAGDKIPGDGIVIEAKDLAVDEAALTGESYPTEKVPGIAQANAPLAQRHNSVFLGTHVVSGAATALVVGTGRATELGMVSRRLRWQPPQPEFERGVRRFGILLTEITAAMLVVTFAINAYFKEPILDSLMFALALAVGLTPQLLPAIVSVNLAHGSRRLAQQQVIVRRLSSIENLGSLNVLCCDKTGTLTEGKMAVHSVIGVDGRPSAKVARMAFLNSTFETGFANPVDAVIRQALACDIGQVEKLDELPFDFIRKRLGVLVRDGDRQMLIVKGATASVLSVCQTAELAGGERVALAEIADEVDRIFRDLSSKGLRVVAVAQRNMAGQERVSRLDEADMTLLGFVVLRDPPKAGVVDALRRLHSQGVALKVISGDHRLVVAAIAEEIGLKHDACITGAGLRLMSDDALMHQATTVDLFAEIEPNQKERIVLALRKVGCVVGFLGDGINDVSAMHAADVGISVDQAVDVAKEAADIVLLQCDLQSLSDGISEGRITFANTMKYIFMATSANFGNMFSMAVASLLLPFLPLLPKQVLLINLLTDLPEMMIARDRVDLDWIDRPRGWDVAFIRRFMFLFGPLSSVFDLFTFGVLLILAGASPEQFRAGWFVESVVSAALIVLVVRTRRPAWKSAPSRSLAIATVAVIGTAVLIPMSPLAALLGFSPLTPLIYLQMFAIVAIYVVAAEIAKRLFYRLSEYRNRSAEA